jgi:hypothetical protein
LRHIKATEEVILGIDEYAIFLGGSIEMNTAEKWQDRLARELSYCNDNLVLLNPRRDDWDSSWVQDPTPGTQFHKQVTWELDYQDDADVCVYYFDPSTKSPITLLELGCYGCLNPDIVVVCCPTSFWRYGNVAMFCARHNITLVHSFDELVTELKEWLPPDVIGN